MLSVGRGGERVCDDGVCVAGFGRLGGGGEVKRGVDCFNIKNGGVVLVLLVGWLGYGLGDLVLGCGLE